MIRYVKGDVTNPDKQGYFNVIVHVCNDVGGWGPAGRSVASAISARWDEPEHEYRQQFEAGAPGLKLGEVQLVDVSPQLWVANCIAQHNYRRPGNLTPFKHDAFETCLGFLARAFAGKNPTFHMPRVGCGLGGTKWEDVEPLILRTLVDAELSVTIYDLP